MALFGDCLNANPAPQWVAGMLAAVMLGPSGRIVCPTFARGSDRRVVRMVLAVRRVERVGGVFGPYNSAVVLDGMMRRAVVPIEWLDTPTRAELARCQCRL